MSLVRPRKPVISPTTPLLPVEGSHPHFQEISGHENGSSDSTPYVETSKVQRLKARRASRYITTGNNSFNLPVNCLPHEVSKRKLIWQFLDGSIAHEGRLKRWSKRFEWFCALLILLNVTADVLDSVPQFPWTEDNSPSFRVLERFSCAVFSVEYVLRLWSCVESDKLMRGNSWVRRLRWMTKIMPMIDLLVVIVFYTDIFMSSDKSRGFQTLRVIRTLRLMALFKMERQTQSFQTVFHVFYKKRHDLFATLFLALVLLIIASTAMYYVETEDQPDKFASIPATMWWSVTAMTTVGYGDIYPISITGKVLGSVVAFLGIGLFALPSGIISSGFVEVLEERRQADTDDLADILDEDKASIDKLHEEVLFLRSQLVIMQSRMQRSEDDADEAKETQKKALALLEQLVQRQGEQPNLERQASLLVNADAPKLARRPGT